MRIIVTRPEEDAGQLRTRLEGLGHQVIVVPLLSIVPRPAAEIPDLPYQAIAATSANGIRLSGVNKRLASIRILTVGPQSLKAAQSAGFIRAEAHGGGVNGLARYMRANLDPAAGPILYLSGAETTGDLQGQLAAAGFDCVRAILYDAVAATGLGAAGDALLQGNAGAVLLYSPRSARIWRGLAEKAKLNEKAARPHYLCLSRNVAAILPEAWRRHVAAAPDEAAMLALLDQISRTR